MYKIIAPVQTVDELLFVKKSQPNAVILPLELSTLLYCNKNKFSFIDPSIYSDNNLHLEIIEHTNCVLANISISSGVIAFDSYFMGVCRFYLHLVFFIKILVDRIVETDPKTSFLVSGYDKGSNHFFSENFYYVSKILNTIFSDRTSSLQGESKPTVFDTENFVLDTKRFPKVDVLIPGLGYNFDRLSRAAAALNLKVGILSVEQRSLISRAYHKLKGVRIIDTASLFSSANKSKVFHWYFTPSDLVDDLLNDHLRDNLHILNSEFNKCLYFRNTIALISPKISASMATRGYLGAFLDDNSVSSTNSICIPHGSVTAPRIDNDYSYRTTIAEAVFFGKTKFLALQSKIALQAYQAHKPTGEPIISGNLIFNEREKLSSSRRQILLYAVTLKNLHNMQFYGVETYYEFFDNLKKLVLVASQVDVPIVVKLHPAIACLKDTLSDAFPSLEFVSDGLKALLDSTLLTISFSSTVIEDSLCSGIPVVLFDSHCRYQHCSDEGGVFYVTNPDELVGVIQLILSSPSFDFSDHTIEGKSADNLKKILLDYA